MDKIKVYQCRVCKTACTIPYHSGVEDPTNCPFNGTANTDWKLVKVGFFDLIKPFMDSW